MSRRVVPETEPLWRALADPTRREVLDVLRHGPATTGALCARFPTSRHTVMGHLDVLVEAGMVVVERRGRERLNHLNPAPLHDAYRRWVAPMAHTAADVLGALAADLDRPGAADTDKEMTMHSIDVRAERLVPADPDRTWRRVLALPEWWPQRWAAGERLTFDPRLGGHLAVVGDDGSGELWGTVTRLRPRAELVVDGAMGLPGPVVGQWSLALQPADGGTRVTVAHRVDGAVDDDTRACYAAGWAETLDSLAASAVAR